MNRHNHRIIYKAKSKNSVSRKEKIMTPERFYETIEPFKEKLYGFAFRMLGNRDDTKDALQDVLLKLWKMRFEIDTGRVESLAMTIMKNVCIDRLREKKKLNGHTSDFAEINGYTLTNFGDKDLLKRVGEEIKNLPEMQRVIIDLKDIQGYSYEEIGQITGLNINAIRVNVSRARKKLIEIFGKEVTNEYGT